MPGERPETALIGGLVKKEGGPLAWCVSTGGIRADVVPVSPLPVAVANATGAYAVRGREAPHTGGGLLACSHTRDAGELGTATTATALWIAQIADIIKFQTYVAGVVALLPVAALVRRATSAPRLVAEPFVTALAVLAAVWAGCVAL